MGSSLPRRARPRAGGPRRVPRPAAATRAAAAPRARRRRRRRRRAARSRSRAPPRATCAGRAASPALRGEGPAPRRAGGSVPRPPPGPRSRRPGAARAPRPRGRARPRGRSASRARAPPAAAAPGPPRARPSGCRVPRRRRATRPQSCPVPRRGCARVARPRCEARRAPRRRGRARRAARARRRAPPGAGRSGPSLVALRPAFVARAELVALDGVPLLLLGQPALVLRRGGLRLGECRLQLVELLHGRARASCGARSSSSSCAACVSAR